MSAQAQYDVDRADEEHDPFVPLDGADAPKLPEPPTPAGSSRQPEVDAPPRSEPDDVAPHEPQLPQRATPRLTPSQLTTFDQLLAVGGSRPTAPPNIAAELRMMIEEGTRDALDRWTERSMWVGKSQLATVLRCEGQQLADAAQSKNRPMMAATAVGIAAHRAIQIAHTHPGRSVEDYVRLALAGARSEEQFAEFWERADEGVQSDCIVTAISRVTGFLDDFPPLDATWTPRFEESIQAKLTGLVLSARPDLVLGRPRPDGRQTMFITDVKSGEIRDDHLDEAHFYALIATMRFGTPPFRSCVYSLASGDWTEPDVTPKVLRDAAQRVVTGVIALVDVLSEARLPKLAPGRHCTWCPSKPTCPAYREWDASGRPEDAAAHVRITAPPTAAPDLSEVSAGSTPSTSAKSSRLTPSDSGDDDPYALD